MILVDTSIWISALHGVEDEGAARLTRAVATGQVIVGDLILMEVLRGARSEASASMLHRRLRMFPIVPMGGHKVAERAAAYYRQLRSKGITVRSSIDMFIATFCIEHDHALLHKDRDFAHISQILGLRTFAD